MSYERLNNIGMKPPHPGDFIIRQRADTIDVQRYKPA
jgi:hypothetical protein